MGLLRPRTHKDMATRIVCSVLDSGTRVGSVDRVSMLFRFIRPLVHDMAGEGASEPGAGGGEAAPTVDDMDDEVRLTIHVMVFRHSMLEYPRVMVSWAVLVEAAGMAWVTRCV